MTLTLKDAEVKFQLIAAGTGIDLQTPEEKEEAAKEEARAQEQFDREQEKAAKEAAEQEEKEAKAAEQAAKQAEKA